jgi:hypothetical protein
MAEDGLGAKSVDQFPHSDWPVSSIGLDQWCKSRGTQHGLSWCCPSCDEASEGV